MQRFIYNLPGLYMRNAPTLSTRGGIIFNLLLAHSVKRPIFDGYLAPLYYDKYIY